MKKLIVILLVILSSCSTDCKMWYEKEGFEHVVRVRKQNSEYDFYFAKKVKIKGKCIYLYKTKKSPTDSVRNYEICGNYLHMKKR